MNIVVRPTVEKIVEAFAVDFKSWIDEIIKAGRQCHVALSGGSTPKALFRHWAKAYKESLPWEDLHFYWGDERCVPPDDPQSNYGMTKELLFDPLGIPDKNIHRIIGENEPSDEAIRYGEEMSKSMPSAQGYPKLDVNLLGMGDDGHTASIFANQMDLLRDMNVCAVAFHPQSKQRRITMTGPVLCHARRSVFLVTGVPKADIFGKIRDKKENYLHYPAAHITGKEHLAWYVDEACAGQ